MVTHLTIHYRKISLENSAHNQKSYSNSNLSAEQIQAQIALEDEQAFLQMTIDNSDKEEVVLPMKSHNPNDPRDFDPNTLTGEARLDYFLKVKRILERREFLKNNTRYVQASTEEFHHHLPKMIIVGSKKCGTGALAKALAMHPLIKYSGEMFYFLRYSKQHDLKWYAKHLAPSRNSDLPFEKTPIYLFSASIARKIKREIPDVKIINIMCDPVKRIYSDFLHWYNLRNKQDEATGEKFEELVNSGLVEIYKRKARVLSGNTTWNAMWKLEDSNFAIHGSNFQVNILKSAYSIYLKEWYKLFKKDINFLNLDGSELYTDPGKIFTQVQKFLNLPVAITGDNFFYNENRGLFCKIDVDGVPSCPGAGKGRSTKSVVSDGVKQKLRDVLAEFTRELEVMEGKKFDHWAW